MSYLVLRTSTADEQTREIAHYIADTSGSANLALGFVDRLEAAAERLSELPNRGAVPRWGTLARQGYRYVTMGEYLILYKVYEDREGVIVHAVVHGRREWWRIVGGEG